MRDNPYSGFETWYSDSHARVLHMLTVVSGNPDAASEATDEAFARALARWQRVRTMSSPTGWTCRVGLNQLRRRARRRRHERELLLSSVESRREDVDPSLWLQVLEAVRDLTVRQRTVLALTYVTDLPQEEVAKLLHISRSTVASTLSDARSAVLSHEVGPIAFGSLEASP
jgi:RNA polymerase sigma factor (sigma-70 family)